MPVGRKIRNMAFCSGCPPVTPGFKTRHSTIPVILRPRQNGLREGTQVKRIGKIRSLLLAGVLTIGPAASGQQEKPRVYIGGTGNVDVRTDGTAAAENPSFAGVSQSTESLHNQTTTLAKDFSKQCPGVTVTLNASDADYAVEPNHVAFHGLIHKNNQAMVTNRRGDLLSSQASHTASLSSNDSCAAILADWKTNGRIEVPAPASASAPPAASAAAPQQQASATPAAPPSAPPGAAQPSMQVMDPKPVSLGEVSRRLKAQKENPPPSPQN